MKLITVNKITSATSSAVHLSAQYASSNVLTDQPAQAWIDQGGDGTPITLTCALSADSDGFFLYNWLADTLEYSVNGGGAYTTLSSAGENFISDNLEEFSGNEITTKPCLTVTALTSASGLILRLTTSVDRKDSPSSGNAIANWETDDDATGHFEDSSNATINISNHGRVLLGSHVDVNGSLHQVTKIIGDGTSASDITLSGSPPAGTSQVDTIKNPVKVGIIRAGTIETFNNAKIGLQQAFIDYSIRRNLANGAFVPTSRNTARLFSGELTGTVTEANALIAVNRAYRAKPVPMLLLNGMPGGDDEAFNYSIWGYFMEPPAMTFGGSQGDLRTVNFRVKELL